MSRPWGRDERTFVQEFVDGGRHGGTELSVVQEGIPELIPLEMCYLGWQESLEQLRVLWHGQRIAVHVTDAAPGPGVDTPEDLERVRRLFR